jgi:hypothetical protein
MTDRDRWICADEDALLAECDVQTFRGPGPGGQHRNKTSSAVRVTHRPTGLAGVATNKRSQVDNRREATLELRRAIALSIRRPVGDVDPLPGVLGRLIVVAQALDALEENGWSLRDAAAALATTTGQLVRRLSLEPEALTLVNARRRTMGLKSIGA